MTSVIEEDLTLEGDVKSKEGTIEVKGKVLGNVAAASVLLYQSGTISGAVTATSVSLEGRYQGTLKCDDLRVAATSNVEGDFSASTIKTESGAIFVGKVNVSG